VTGAMIETGRSFSEQELNKEIDKRLQNPGKFLEAELKVMFPQGQAGYLGEVDGFLKLGGAFLDTMYGFTIVYLVRYLIVSAHFLMKKKNFHDPDHEEFQEILRSYLSDFFQFVSAGPSDRLVVLLTACLRVIKKKRKNHSMLLKERKRSGAVCYLSGFTPKNDEAEYRAELDHVWPLAFGGGDQADNLELSCSKYNRLKDDFINPYDYDFRKIMYRSIGSEPLTMKEFKVEHKLAILAKHNFSIDGCTQQKHGRPFGFRKIDENQPWHYFNIEIYKTENEV